MRSRTTAPLGGCRQLRFVLAITLHVSCSQALAQSVADDEGAVGVRRQPRNGDEGQRPVRSPPGSWWEEDEGSGRGRYQRWEDEEPRRAAGARPRLEARGPWAFGGGAAVGIGFFFSTYSSLFVSVGRQFLNRLDLELDGHLMIGRDLIGLEVAVRVGVLLHLSRRWCVDLFWRIGVAEFRLDLPIEPLWTTSLAMAVGAEVRVLLRPTLELRFSPIVATGFWNQVWGFTVEPAVSVAYRF